MNLQQAQRFVGVRRTLVALGVVALLLASCGRRGTTPVATPAPTQTPTPQAVPADVRTIEFTVFAPGFSGFAEANDRLIPTYERLAEAFHTEHPDLMVKIKQVGQDWALQSAMEKGTDAVLTYIGTISFDDLLPLDTLVGAMHADFLDDVFPAALDAVRRDGALMALPVEIGTYVIYYNKARFDEARVPYPSFDWVWDDLLATAQALTQPSNVQRQPAHYGLAPFSSIFFVLQETGGDVFRSGELRLDGEPVMRAVRWYTDLSRVHEVMPNLPLLGSMMYGENGDALLTGHIAMWFGVTGVTEGRFADTSDTFKVGVAPLPKGTYDDWFLIGRMAAIPTLSEHPEDAWKWLVFLSERADELMDGMDFLPAQSSLLQGAALERQFGTDAANAFFRILSEGTPLPAFLLYSPYWSALWEAELGIMGGRGVRLSVEEALQEAQGQLDESPNGE